MWSLLVVAAHPGIDRLLGSRGRFERRYVVEELLTQGPVETLDLAGRGGRTRLGAPLGDAVLPADPLEEHLDRLRAIVASGELPAVVGQYLRGHPIAAHRLGERLTHRPPRRRGDHGRGDDEPRVVIDAGDQLALPPISQRHTADDVELPRVHRRLPLPALVLTPVLLGLRLDQPVTGQHALHRRP